MKLKMSYRTKFALLERLLLAVPCCAALCCRLWLAVVVLALFRSVLVRTCTSAVGRALLRLFEMTILLVPTLAPCGESVEWL